MPYTAALSPRNSTRPPWLRVYQVMGGVGGQRVYRVFGVYQPVKQRSYEASNNANNVAM